LLIEDKYVEDELPLLSVKDNNKRIIQLYDSGTVPILEET